MQINPKAFADVTLELLSRVSIMASDQNLETVVGVRQVLRAIGAGELRLTEPPANPAPPAEPLEPTA